MAVYYPLRPHGFMTRLKMMLLDMYKTIKPDNVSQINEMSIWLTEHLNGTIGSREDIIKGLFT